MLLNESQDDRKRWEVLANPRLNHSLVFSSESDKSMVIEAGARPNVTSVWVAGEAARVTNSYQPVMMEFLLSRLR